MESSMIPDDRAITFFLRKFEELSVDELYEILRVRAEVFVVEQQCAYLDVDGTDKVSEHLFLRDASDGRIIAYARLYPRGDDPLGFQIGRVLTTIRGHGYGALLLQKAIEHIRTKPGILNLYAEAQVQARGFYERAGFVSISEPFLEDDIPHVLMRWTAAQ